MMIEQRYVYEDKLGRCILMELEYVRRKQGRETLRRHIEARGDPEAILACYRRLQRYLQRLCVSEPRHSFN